MGLLRGSVHAILLAIVVIGVFASITVLAGDNITNSRPFEFLNNLVSSPCNQINCPPTPPPPTPTPVAAVGLPHKPFCYPQGDKFGYGDLNEDGSVTIFDVSLVQEAFLKDANTPQLKRADLDGDGKISILDLAIITSGNPTRYSICANKNLPSPFVLKRIREQNLSCYQGKPKIPFSWTPATNATGYWVDVSKSRNFAEFWNVKFANQVNANANQQSPIFSWSASDPLFKDKNGTSFAPENDTAYYARAYAYNNLGGTHSNVVKFETISCK